MSWSITWSVAIFSVSARVYLILLRISSLVSGRRVLFVKAVRFSKLNVQLISIIERFHRHFDRSLSLLTASQFY